MQRALSPLPAGLMCGLEPVRLAPAAAPPLLEGSVRHTCLPMQRPDLAKLAETDKEPSLCWRWAALQDSFYPITALGDRRQDRQQCEATIFTTMLALLSTVRYQVILLEANILEPTHRSPTLLRVPLRLSGSMGFRCWKGRPSCQVLLLLM